MIKPLGNKIVVEPEKEDTTKNIGNIKIHIPETGNKERPERGKVIAVGIDVKEVGNGNTVLFKKFGPASVKIDGVDYIILEEDDILAIID